jgi:hypothetical protein
VGKPKTSEKDIAEIIRLRKSGLSLDGIHKIVPQGKTTIFTYIKDVKVDFDLRGTGSKNKSDNEWKYTKSEAVNLLGDFSKQSKLLILASLYWGEGNKKELNLINSDPELVRVFISCLGEIGVNNNDVKISLRLFSDINKSEARIFWSNITGVSFDRVLVGEIIKGKKAGKLKFGMCRVRVRKSHYYFKLIMNMIDLLKSKL